MKILTQSTHIALWYEIVHEAESICAFPLQEEIEAYLVFMLARHMTQTNLTSQPAALGFMGAMQLAHQQRHAALQGVGDQCLLLTGFYPMLAKRRHVSLKYFVRLGQAAYQELAATQRDIYAQLTQQFVNLMDILQSIRQQGSHPDLLPLEAFETWQDVGSRRAFRILQQYTGAVPIFMPSKQKS